MFALLGGIIEGAFLGSGGGAEQITLNTFLVPLTAKSTIPFVGNIWMAVTDLSWWEAALKIAMFDYAFLGSSNWLFLAIFFLPVGISVVVVLGIVIVRGVASG